MVKQNKTICLDKDIIDKLDKESSASKLINDLLRDYFILGWNFKKNKKMEISNKISVKTLEIEKMQEELELIERKEKEIKEVFKNIPDEIIETFKIFGEKINYQNRFKEIWSKKYKLTLKEVKKAYDYYFEKEDNEKIL